MNASNPTSHTLPVPGASLYFETYPGHGPLLLLIPGGPTDAGIYAGLAHELSADYRVVAYDPRGNSRSRLEGRPVELNMDVHGDDAAHLIAHLSSSAPVFVFGNSGGAQIGLNLTARYQEKVRTLIAHEPPCMRLLPESEKLMTDMVHLESVARNEGVKPAMALFAQLTGTLGGPPRDKSLDPETQATLARTVANLPYFTTMGARAIAVYRPDIEALKGARVVVGYGRDSHGELANRTARALASQLGVTGLEFPGGHNGYGPYASEFATRLHQALNA